MVTIILIVLTVAILTLVFFKSPKIDRAINMVGSSTLAAIFWLFYSMISYVEIHDGPDSSYETTVNDQRYYCDRSTYTLGASWFWPGYSAEKYSNSSSKAECFEVTEVSKND